MIDLVHPATRHDEAIITLHSLLDRDVYRGGAIVVGPVRRGRGPPGPGRAAGRSRLRRSRAPLQVLEREMWRIAVERLDYSEQHVWAALAGARVQPNSWRKAKAMLQHDQAEELRRRFLLTCIQRNRTTQLRLQRARRARAHARGGAVRRGDRHGRHLAARPAPRRRPRSCSRRWPSAGSAAATRPRPGSGASPSSPATRTRSTRSRAGPRPSACSGCSSTPPDAPTARTPAGSSRPPAARTAASRSRCSPPRSRTRPRPRRSSAAPGCGWRESPRRVARELLRNLPKGERKEAPPAQQALARGGGQDAGRGDGRTGETAGRGGRRGPSAERRSGRDRRRRRRRRRDEEAAADEDDDLEPASPPVSASDHDKSRDGTEAEAPQRPSPPRRRRARG